MGKLSGKPVTHLYIKSYKCLKQLSIQIVEIVETHVESMFFGAGFDIYLRYLHIVLARIDTKSAAWISSGVKFSAKLGKNKTVKHYLSKWSYNLFHSNADVEVSALNRVIFVVFSASGFEPRMSKKR